MTQEFNRDQTLDNLRSFFATDEMATTVRRSLVLPAEYDFRGYEEAVRASAPSTGFGDLEVTTNGLRRITSGNAHPDKEGQRSFQSRGERGLMSIGTTNVLLWQALFVHNLGVTPQEVARVLGSAGGRDDLTAIRSTFSELERAGLAERATDETFRTKIASNLAIRPVRTPDQRDRFISGRPMIPLAARWQDTKTMNRYQRRLQNGQP